MYNIDEVKALRSLVDVVGERVDLKKNGKEYIGLCPFHSEKTPSFAVIPDKEFYYCQGCGAGGDIFDFVMEVNAVNFSGACEILGGKRKARKGIATKKAVKKVIISCYDGIEPVLSIPSQAVLIAKNKKTPPIWNPKRDEKGIWRESTYKPEMVFEYTAEDGQLIGYVLRVVIGGKKLTPQIMWCKRKAEDGEYVEGWCHFSLPEPRPLYGLAELYRNPDAPVLIVEGEKCVDAAHRLLSEYNVVSWPGGTKAFSKAGWGPLRGKKVTLWPDADEPGAETMALLAKKLLEIGAESIRIIQWDKDKPKGWDVADAEAEKWTGKKITDWGKERIISYPEPQQVEPPEDEMPPLEAYNEDHPGDATPARDTPPKKETDHTPPFRALGYRNNMYYYLPDKTQQIMKLSMQAHTKNSYLLLFGSRYLETHYQTKKGVDLDAVYESLMNLQNRAGIFDEHNKIRGRGAWIDAGRTVLHLGSHVYVDGKPFEPKDVDSKFAYPKDIDLDIDALHPATTKEAQALMDICRNLNWKHPLSGPLLAGWLIIAPVCGMLKWRPHLWITGRAGSGKSTIMETVISKVMGKIAQVVSSNTTEAAIRQTLGQDALPIILDEFESNDPKSAGIIQGVLGLARMSSSGGVIQKGTADGTGQSYRVKSCFLFGSINTSLHHKADEDRISTLILQADLSEGSDERWQKQLANILKTCTNSFADKMLSRTLKNLKTLQINCDTFTEAVAMILKSRRIADQVGTLLAGAHLCHNTKEISFDEAVKWVKKQDWTEHTTIEAKGDEERLFDRLFTSRIRFNAASGMKETSLGELIVTAAFSDFETDSDISKIDAERELRLYGLKVEDEEVDGISKAFVYIANKSDPIKKLLKETPWVVDWGRPLKDLEGAETADMMYFSAGINSRATKLPVSLFIE